MPRIKFNDGQEVIFQDLDKIAQAIEKELLDRVGYHMVERQVNCVFHDSFLVEYLSATQVTVRAGQGFQTDNTQTDPEPTKRLLHKGSSTTLALAAADGANPRIDIVSIKANRATALSENRNFKDITDVLSVVSMVVKTDWEADLLVTTGTPAGSPAVPSTPAGYIKIAELAIAAVTGLPSTGGITDKRAVVLPGSSRSAYAAKTAAYTATLMDEMILADATGGAFSVTLPPAAISAGKILRVKKTDSSANAVTIDGSGAETIDGESTQSLDTQYSCLTMLSNGTEWSILS